jgi:hypothetical protein
VQRKIEKLRPILRKYRTGEAMPAGLPWQPREQALTILQSIHGYIFQLLNEFAPGSTLRLGVYLPAVGRQQMELTLSWNGHAHDCYSRTPGKMLLVNATGIYSIVVRTFHSPGNHVLHLTPDPKKELGFEFWTARQHEQLRSIAAFKYQLEIDGTESALVLEMDCNAAGFFDESRREPLSELLVEMLRRFEYELICAELPATVFPSREEVKMLK